MYMYVTFDAFINSRYMKHIKYKCTCIIKETLFVRINFHGLLKFLDLLFLNLLIFLDHQSFLLKFSFGWEVN